MIFSKAALVSVGTELTTGQTENTNVSWLSRELVSLGIEPKIHLVVADDRQDILGALRVAAEDTSLLVVTGGLGPTTDDFTREVISTFSSRELEFDQASWERISERLSKFGIRVAESNRQQCLFPEGSRILPNPAGTAAGFHVPATGFQPDILVLPGPPREVEAIWNSGLKDWVAERSPGIKTKLLTWQCLGKSEAELGEIVEAALAGSSLITGYRAHRPYVEVKVWSPLVPTPAQEEKLKALEAAIRPWCVQSPGQASPLDRFLSTVATSGLGLVIEDFGSASLLTERLGPALRKRKELGLWCLISGSESSKSGIQGGERLGGDSWCLRLTELVLGQKWEVRLQKRATGHFAEWTEVLESPFRISGATEPVRDMMQERVLRWAAEAALVWAVRVLEAPVSES